MAVVGEKQPQITEQEAERLLRGAEWIERIGTTYAVALLGLTYFESPAELKALAFGGLAVSALKAARQSPKVRKSMEEHPGVGDSS